MFGRPREGLLLQRAIKVNAPEITPMYVTQMPRTQTKSIMFLGYNFRPVRMFG